MSDMNYAPNSHKSKAEAAVAEKRVEKPVVTGQVKVKKNELRKFTDAFISEDAGNVKSYILTDVLIPAIKKVVSDIIKDSIDMILYGEIRGSKKRSVSDRVSYNKYYDRRDDERYESSRSRNEYSYDDIVFETRGEAEAVRSALDDIVDTYGFARVADLYDLIGETGRYTDNDYCWYNLRNAEIVRTRDGYRLKMPRAVPIK